MYLKVDKMKNTQKLVTENIASLFTTQRKFNKIKRNKNRTRIMLLISSFLFSG